MQIKNEVLLSKLTSGLSTLCSEKAKQKEKKIAFRIFNCTNRSRYKCPRESAYFYMWRYCSWLFLNCASFTFATDPQVHILPSHKKTKQKKEKNKGKTETIRASIRIDEQHNFDKFKSCTKHKVDCTPIWSCGYSLTEHIFK